MTATANALPCVEVRNYTARVEGTRFVVSYEWRGPGETDWQHVRLSRTARPEDRANEPETRAA